MHGFGTLKYTDGRIYEGSFCQGRIIGRGKLRYPDGQIYVGDFYNDVPEGTGILKFINSKCTYIGEWH